MHQMRVIAGRISRLVPCRHVEGEGSAGNLVGGGLDCEPNGRSDGSGSVAQLERNAVRHGIGVGNAEDLSARSLTKPGLLAVAVLILEVGHKSGVVARGV